MIAVERTDGIPDLARAARVCCARHTAVTGTQPAQSERVLAKMDATLEPARVSTKLDCAADDSMARVVCGNESPEPITVRSAVRIGEDEHFSARVLRASVPRRVRQQTMRLLKERPARKVLHDKVVHFRVRRAV